MNNSREERKQRLIRQIKQDIIIKLSVFATGLIVTFTCIFGVTLAPTNDMFPAIHEGDVIIYFRLGGLAGSDIACYEADGAANIGRVQAVEGMQVDKTEGGLLRINGNIQPIQERSGLYYKTYIREGGGLEYPSVVPAGHYLILGDERDGAKDSRDYGYIPEEEIKGKIFTIIRRRPL